MHWRNCFDVSTLHSISKRSNKWLLMLKMLHLITSESDALTMWFDVKKTASDRDAVKCTDEIVWLSDCCIWSFHDQMHADNCLLSKLHLMLMSSNALTKMFDCQIAAFDRETIKCTLTIVCCQNCIWCRCHQMHWKNCLIVRLLHLISNDQMHADDYLWRKFVDQTFFAMKRRKLHSMLKLLNALMILFVVRNVVGQIICWRKRNVWYLLKLQTDWLIAKQIVDWLIEMLIHCNWWSFFVDLMTENLIKRNELTRIKRLNEIVWYFFIMKK